MEKLLTPELDKLEKIKHFSQIIGEFLDFLQMEKDYVICERIEESLCDDEFAPIVQSKESLLAEFFHIDLNKVEQEKMMILSKIRGD